ncbi:alpha/beta fold hydrolase [Dictyobacter kobayashii]|uniref:Alpha/beta hydrolase n=1 Tax=Dictyobacter kobayashii TaxID=2014872 RepID=A0A402AGU5_9CHLR|nr:alpha/beta fold hydrolase [Dictyobacter kobayashii]GCE18274.1 alpha/beta hydrolase [Dictyobacter kobayashii]
MAIAKKLFNTSLVLGGALGALALYNKVTETMAGELDTVLTGEERRYPWKYGDMFYEVKGSRDAKPLVLIHGFGPGASSYEWRKNIDTLAEQFRVYALDLLGFGLSDHPAIDYDAETYTDLLNDFIREVVGKPAIVVAHGLTSAYVIAAAYRRPQLFERLVLVGAPTTILQESYPGPLNALQKFILRTPIIGQFIYNTLTSRQAIRGYYDGQGYHNPGLITDELVEYIYTSAHQPNSRHASAAFLSSHLHLDVHEPLARLQVPVVAVWGREGFLTPAEASSTFKRVNPRIDVRIIDKATLQIQDEQAAQFNNLIREFAGAPVK